MTSNFKPLKLTDSIERNDTEAKVRRALGLESSSSGQSPLSHSSRPGERVMTDRPKSRFIRDGDVPVVMIRRDNEQNLSDPRRAMCGHSTSRLEVAEKALKTERHARETAERSLAEAQAVIHDLQTKLGHAVLISDEACANARRVEIEKRACERALAVEQKARQTSDVRLLNMIPASDLTTAAGTKSRAKRTLPTVAVTKSSKEVGMRRPPEKLEPQPVKWWLKKKGTPSRLA